MNLWRAAEAFLRLLTVAVVLVIAAMLAIPHSRSTDPDDQPSSHKAEAAITDLRIRDRKELFELIRCRPSHALDADTIDQLKKAAEDNKDTAARYALGVAYLTGNGVRCDPDRAADLLTAAADAQFVPALYVLGIMSETGRGAPQDIEDAAAFYQRAAVRGHVLAMRRLAELLLQTDKDGRDNKGIISWLTAAANHGDTDSQVNLGLIYQDGEDYDVENSSATAYCWFEIAAQLGDPAAADLKRRAARDLDSDEIDDANQRANAWRAEPEDSEANADFDSIVQKFGSSPPSDTDEPTTSAAPDSPAS